MCTYACRAGGADSQGAGVGAGEEASKGGGRASGEREAGGGGGQGSAGSAGCRPDEDPGTTGTCAHTYTPLSIKFILKYD